MKHGQSTIVTVLHHELVVLLIATGDTIYFACTLFNMFDDAGSDTLTETFPDSVMPETMNLFSSVPTLISQELHV